jgi:hypothetical protein
VDKHTSLSVSLVILSNFPLSDLGSVCSKHTMYIVTYVTFMQKLLIMTIYSHAIQTAFVALQKS